jgi:hypothetical protein
MANAQWRRVPLGWLAERRGGVGFSCPCVGGAGVIPVEVVIDAAPAYPAVLEELIPSAWHHVQRWVK